MVKRWAKYAGTIVAVLGCGRQINDRDRADAATSLASVRDAARPPFDAGPLRPDSSGNHLEPGLDAQVSTLDASFSPDGSGDAGAAIVTDASRDAGSAVVRDAGHDAATPPSADAAAPVAFTCPAEAEPIPLAPLTDAAGFVDVEAADYMLPSAPGAPLHSSETRFFYSLRAAEQNSESAPLFVFFNGGPGTATSAYLMLNGTGPKTLPVNVSSAQLEDNPHSWTRMGNLLYLDARLTGFSYSVIEDPSDPAALGAEFRAENYGVELDAGDFARALLGIFDLYPALRDNPIVIVGESFGGIRTTMLLMYLMSPDLLDTPYVYQDPALAERIRAHHCVLHPGAELDSSLTSQQFPAQILIQPFIGGNQLELEGEYDCSPGSIEAITASQLGQECPAQSQLHQGMPASWEQQLDSAAGAVLGSLDGLEAALGVDVATVPGFSAATRVGAFRNPEATDVSMSSEFLASQGELPDWDSYYQIYAPWTSTTLSERAGCYFLLTARRVAPFITRASMDAIIHSELFAPTLDFCSRLWASPLLDSIVLDEDARDGVARPGWMQLQYASALDGAPNSVELRLPRYEESGHMVSVSQPQELFEDVQQFLQERGVLP